MVMLRNCNGCNSIMMVTVKMIINIIMKRTTMMTMMTMIITSQNVEVFKFCMHIIELLPAYHHIIVHINITSHIIEYTYITT